LLLLWRKDYLSLIPISSMKTPRQRPSTLLHILVTWSSWDTAIASMLKLIIIFLRSRISMDSILRTMLLDRVTYHAWCFAWRYSMLILMRQITLEIQLSTILWFIKDFTVSFTCGMLDNAKMWMVSWRVIFVRLLLLVQRRIVSIL
jgi:hypothetical protein